MWGVTRIVPAIKEKTATNKTDMLIYEFMTAYTQLRASCPDGDLRIHLSIDEFSLPPMGAPLRTTQAE